MGDALMTATTAELAERWGTSPRRIARWCRLHLLASEKQSTGWRVAAGVRPPYMDGGMILQWLEETEQRSTAE